MAYMCCMQVGVVLAQWAHVGFTEHYDKLVRHGLGFRGRKTCDAWHPKLTLT